MEKNFLLTYEIEEDNKIKFEYDWFETEEDMKDFIEVHNVKVAEALEIISCREIF